MILLFKINPSHFLLSPQISNSPALLDLTWWNCFPFFWGRKAIRKNLPHPLIHRILAVGHCLCFIPDILPVTMKPYLCSTLRSSPTFLHIEISLKSCSTSYSSLSLYLKTIFRIGIHTTVPFSSLLFSIESLPTRPFSKIIRVNVISDIQIFPQNDPSWISILLEFSALLNSTLLL